MTRSAFKRELQERFHGDKWSRRAARAAVPFLIECAKNGEPITYSALDCELAHRHDHLELHTRWSIYAWPLGVIGEAIEDIQNRQIAQRKRMRGIRSKKIMPPLQTLVVRKDTGIPGKGYDPYLRSYWAKRFGKKAASAIRRLDIDDWEERVLRLQEEVYNWNDWSVLVDAARDRDRVTG